MLFNLNYQLDKKDTIPTSKIQYISIFFIFVCNPLYNQVHYPFAKPNFSYISIFIKVFQFSDILLIPTKNYIEYDL